MAHGDLVQQYVVDVTVDPVVVVAGEGHGAFLGDDASDGPGHRVQVRGGKAPGTHGPAGCDSGVASGCAPPCGRQHQSGTVREASSQFGDDACRQHRFQAKLRGSWALDGRFNGHLAGCRPEKPWWR